PITALGDHHRVHHHVRQLVPVDRLGDGLGDLGGGEHSDLDRVHARVGQERVELVRDELGGNTVHPGDTAGGLGGECGDHTHPEGAVGGEGLQVGLDPRASAGVAAGHGHNVVRAHGGPFASAN